jgi:hypothetical protein
MIGISIASKRSRALSFARARIFFDAWLDMVLLNPILAVFDLCVQWLSRFLLPTYSAQTSLWFLNSMVLLLVGYHLLFSKLRLYYWKIVVIVVVDGFLLQQIASLFAFSLGFAESPILYDLLLFLSHHIMSLSV